MRAINIVTPQRVLESRINREMITRHTTDSIKALLGVNDKQSSKRKRELVIPRQIGIPLAYLFTEETASGAARSFGKDHAIYSHCKKAVMDAIMFNDPLIMPELIRVFKVLYNAHIRLVRIYNTLRPADQRVVDRVATRIETSEIAQQLIKIIKNK